MDNPFEPAISALERRLHEWERKVNELRGAINVLCAEAGLPPRYPDGNGGVGAGGEGHAATPMQIKPDSFYGKRQGTAARLYLEMRRAQGLGPAKPRNVFEALRQGGYQFAAKDDETALVGLRALLRKNTTTFHKLPTGEYGLAIWYPHAKAQKATTEQEDTDQATQAGTPKAPASPQDEDTDEMTTDTEEASVA